MYINKAIGILEYIKKWYKDQFIYEEDEAIDTAIFALKEIQQYRAIGTVEECREAVEKQIPQKPTVLVNDHDVKIGNAIFSKGTKTYKCAACGSWIMRNWKCCSECGQAIKREV